MAANDDSAKPGGDRPNVAEPDYKALFQSVPGLFLVLDPQLRVVAASDAYLQATLTRRDEIMGRDIFEVFPDDPDDPSAGSGRIARASFNRVLHSRQPDIMGLQRHDVRRPASEGGGFEERYWSAANFPLLSADGSLAYIVHRVENVTGFVQVKHHGVEQAKLTEELPRAAALIARKCDAEELRDNYAELRQAHERLQEADRRKNEFLAMLSHELRNPLATITSAIRVLKLRGVADDPRQARTLAAAERQAAHMVRLLDDLLDVARITHGAIELRRESTDLRQVVESAIESVQATIDARGHRLAVSFPAAALVVHADPVRIAQAVGNLLDNAARYTPHGGDIRLSVSREGALFTIRVRDSGVGIEPSLIPRLFELFVQAERSLDRAEGGLGIGLTVTRTLVEMHGGTVDAHSEGPGTGSEFTVRLPSLELGPPIDGPHHTLQ